MREGIPASQQVDAFELTSQGYIDLYKLELQGDYNGTVIYLSKYQQVEYLGSTWENWTCNLSESSVQTTGEKARPKFSVVNTEGVFSLWIDRGATDGAILTRLRVLLSDLKGNLASYERTVWILTKCMSLSKSTAVFECRAPSDGADFKIPNGYYMPPEYPHVTLG